MSMRDKETRMKKEDEATRLYNLIKADELEVTEANANKVKDLWGEAICWDHLFKISGLDFLPDPGGETEHVRIYEEWLVKAYASRNRSEDDVRAALENVRQEIIAKEFEE